MPVWFSHILLIIPNINIEVFPEAEESHWDGIQDITSGVGLIKILYVIQEFFGEVTYSGGVGGVWTS